KISHGWARLCASCFRNPWNRGASLGVMPKYYWVSLVIVIGVLRSAPAAELVLTPKLHHLRSGAVREWADFPEQAEAADLRLTFTARANPAEQTLRLRHRDVKQTWKLRVNDRELGRLPPDENDMATFWAVPSKTLTDGSNVLLISSPDK